MRKNQLALEKIRELIQTEAVGKDGVLFSENELVRLIGVSRTPIRDALSVLSREGLIEQIPQVGIRVRKFKDHHLRELYDVRMFLEAYATERFAVNPTQDAVRQLRGKVQQMRQCAEESDVAGFLNADVTFHFIIAKEAGLELIAELVRQIGERVKVIGYLSTPDTKSMLIVVEEHEEILRALLDKNPEHAREMAVSHLGKTKERLEVARGRTIF